MNDILNIWGKGQILAFSGMDGKTDYHDGLVFRTSFRHPGLDMKLPDMYTEIIFEENGTIAGDFFQTEKLSGVLVDAHHLLMDGPVKVKNGPLILVANQNGKTLVGVKKYFNPGLLKKDVRKLIEERKNCLEALPVPPGLDDISKKTLFKAYSQLKTQICTPEGLIGHRWTTPDRWPHRKMWLHDTVFHAAGLRHLDMMLARETMLAILESARADGFVPLCTSPDHQETMTQPPVLAMGVKLLMEQEFDLSFLKYCYPFLCSYIKWDLANRDSSGDGLLEWEIEEYENCRSGESGMDNSPRFDSALQLDAVDFNSLVAMECGILAEFAKTLNYPEDAKFWQCRQQQLNDRINELLWDDEKKFYFDVDAKTHQSTGVMAFSGFYPLLSGAASGERAKELAGHLQNPATFGTPFRVASVAANCPAYNKDMWRGPVWINVNYLIIRGLENAGLMEEAARLRDETLAKIEENYHRYGVLLEFFDDRNEVEAPDLPRKGPNVHDTFNQPFHDYGWTGTLYIDMLFGNGKKQK